MLVLFTDVSGRSIEPIFKRQAVISEGIYSRYHRDFDILYSCLCSMLNCFFGLRLYCTSQRTHSVSVMKTNHAQRSHMSVSVSPHTVAAVRTFPIIWLKTRMYSFTKFRLLAVAMIFCAWHVWTDGRTDRQTDVLKLMVAFGDAKTTTDEGSILVLWITGLWAHWIVGLWAHWIIGLGLHWIIGLWAHLIIGLWIHLIIELWVHWIIGLRVHCITESWVH